MMAVRTWGSWDQKGLSLLGADRKRPCIGSKCVTYHTECSEEDTAGGAWLLKARGISEPRSTSVPHPVSAHGAGLGGISSWLTW